MSRYDIYYAYQRLYAIAPFISQEEYRRVDARLFKALNAGK